MGFFSAHEDIEEDEYVEFEESVGSLQMRPDVFVGVVTSGAVADHFKKLDWIDRTPSIVLQREGLAGSRKHLNLDTHYGEGGSVAEWIVRASVPLVDRLTGRNFGGLTMF